MIAIIDTDVILDVLLSRKPFLTDSSAVVDKAVLSEYSGIVCATTITNIYYIARKALGEEATLEAISKLMSVFTVAPVNGSIIHDALGSKFTDFEDAILHFSGKATGAQFIVTRNEADYSKSEITVYSPKQFLAALA